MVSGESGGTFATHHLTEHGCRYSACHWRSVLPTTGEKEKESQEQTWCKPSLLVLCLCDGCSRYIAEQHSVSGVCSKFMAVKPLGLQKWIYSYCETSQEMLLYMGLSSS